jgi:hypothetical protein
MPDHPPLKMEISRHAARRWAERVRQDRTIGPRAARSDMQRCAQLGTVRAEAPDWMYASEDEYEDSVYLMLGDDVALVLCRPPNRAWVVVTVMTRHDAGGVHAATLRERRQARRAALHPPPRAGSVLPPRTYDDGLYEF